VNVLYQIADFEFHHFERSAHAMFDGQLEHKKTISYIKNGTTTKRLLLTLRAVQLLNSTPITCSKSVFSLNSYVDDMFGRPDGWRRVTYARYYPRTVWIRRAAFKKTNQRPNTVSLEHSADSVGLNKRSVRARKRRWRSTSTNGSKSSSWFTRRSAGNSTDGIHLSLKKRRNKTITVLPIDSGPHAHARVFMEEKTYQMCGFQDRDAKSTPKIYHYTVLHLQDEKVWNTPEFQDGQRILYRGP